MATHIGISLGALRHWNDGLGEFSKQLSLALAAQAPRLRDELGWHLHFHLPATWHGMFGDAVGYLPTHTTQRWLHISGTRFALWHRLHQHIRLRSPWGTALRVETVHDLNFLLLKQGAKRERYRQRLQARLAACQGVAAITHHVAADLARELPGLTTPVKVIHNGATDLTGVAQVAVAGVGEAPYLLHISRMAPSKNIAALLDLAAAWPQQRIVLAGAESPYTATVAQEVQSRGLHNVHLQLNLSEGQKAWLYAHCQAFLFPSLAEGFGLPPIEAMRFGKPVFLSRLTSLPEVGGEVAHYFDDFSPAAMRNQLQHALQPPLSAEQRARITAHAAQFEWTTCAANHIGWYRERLAQAVSTAGRHT